ncbi:HlyD family type I secretion periplasmic adaptor subunit [Sphaerotilus uruguayifluvii]|uniref:Membrane fusion protein (MFP) family protein n=1 Tax=Sphaerotilus uruguayifluvii TaxID=2735897 RepID=A0ABX2G1Q3_9BURK|nr:HlyD family type I secretion periplasmic adaptor subunit [Leptothrix sp. C29]NRT56238.1 hemolysin D [Leptothrix sp. C29]
MSLKHRIEAWGELIGRYRRAWAHAWSHRRELAPPQYSAEEAEFLPAALSLQARPVSPSGRWTARLLMLLVLALLAWSVIGRTDIVVNAQGRIVPRGQTKALAAVETARVHALHVEEGQAVRAGDLLVELDPRLSDSDGRRAAQALEQAQLQVERAGALLAALDGSGRAEPRLPELPDVDAQQRRLAEQHLQDQWNEYRTRLARLDADAGRLAQELPLAEQRARDYAELLQTRDVSRHAWMEREQARLEIAGQLAAIRSQKLALGAEVRRAAQDSRAEGQRQVDAARAELDKARTHGELLRLVAPVDGTVQQLAVHTVGTAVPAAQPLMQIVPRQAQVEMEVRVENRDIGFVREGQEAQVKIDAFPYTRYGTVPAVVALVSRDAVQDEKRGPVYAVRIALKAPALQVDGRETALTPGLSGSVEIRTGDRRLIEYVLSPLLQHGRESLRER